MDPRSPDRAVEAGRGALFIGFAKVFFMVSGSLQQLLLTWFLGPADFGIFSEVNIAISTVNNTMVQGTIQAVSKFTAEDDNRADAVKRAGVQMQAFLATAVGLTFFFAAPWIARAANAPHYVRYYRLVAVIPFLYGFYAVFVGSANGLRHFRTQATFDVTFSLAKTVLLLGGAVAGAALGSSVMGAFAGFAIAASLILVVAIRVMGWPHRSPGHEFPLKRMFFFMGGVVTYTLLINLALNYDLFLLRRFAGEVLGPSPADALAGNYELVRKIALLPYMALLVVTFVIFPLISRSTFAQDREATRLYVTQTLRYALILVAAMGVVLASRPLGILRLLNRNPAYWAGAGALPILVVGICCLALLSVSGTIINASGRPAVAVALVGTTMGVGSVAAFLLVPKATPGAPMLLAAATATSLGMAAGFVAASIYVQLRFGAHPPLATVVRVLASGLVAGIAAHAVPGGGVLSTLGGLACAGILFLTGLLVTGEFGPEDRSKFRKIVRR